MPIASRSLTLTLCGALALACACLAHSPGPLFSQDKSKPAKKVIKPGKNKPLANTKTLDVKSEQVQAAFIKETDDLATQYIDAGQFDKAKALLQGLLAMNPKLAAVKEKLKQIDESILGANEYEVEVISSHGWESSGVNVFENRPLRLHAEGSYRFDVGTPIGAAGFPDKDPLKDLVAGIPCGALMGVIVVNGKPGKPFLIGEGVDFTPKESGLLALRVNSPAGNKNNGKLKVSISGWVKSP
ncbi:MAG: tetratricopeptide repeat protein [Planctomycetaceae bacterium]|nr:tetratricopeptide repeat protein [Planctomycetaceae bacterium]